MQPLTEKILKQSLRNGSILFGIHDFVCLTGKSGNRLHAMIKRAIAADEMIQIRRGLYCLAARYRREQVDVYTFAQRIYGPSYISMESALSWHGCIPEAVYTVTSVSMKRSVEFDTPLGQFTYDHVPQKTFLSGVQRVETTSRQYAFLADVVKALADYVYVHRKDWTTVEPLINSLRMDMETLNSVTEQDIAGMLQNYRSRRVIRFLMGLAKDLKR